MARNFSSTDRLTAGTSSVLHVAAPMTVAIRYKGSAPGNFIYLFSKELLANEHASYAFATNGSGALQFMIGHGTSSGNVYVSPTVASGTAFAAGWHTAVGTYDTADKVRMYVDGTEAGTGTTGGNTISYDGTKSLWFGVFDGTQLHYGTGASAGDRSLAEVAIWSAVLTTDERAAYDKGIAPRVINPNALVAYWPLIGQQSPEPELANGISATVTSAGTDVHPRTFFTLPRGLLRVGDPNVVSGTGVGGATFNATSTTTLTARRTATAAVTARRSSTSAVSDG